MLIGAPLSSSGGLERALVRAQAIGADCVQVLRRLAGERERGAA